ncbi:MAG: MFS transporter [Oscillospiraceae bacterium]|nr:MFS transporter [Oscillospiraceae bacterium]
MKRFINDLKEMRGYLLLWFTQLISGLGSAMTAYALVIWSYTQAGSALRTALLMVCSYAPYVICSIFAGALSDRWDKKKTMLVCDALAALSTLTVLLLLEHDALRIWHLYIVNAVSGLMNTFQQPASEVATSALLKQEYYQKVGGLRYLSNALNSILTPIITTAIMGLWGIGTVIAIDLGSFVVAFLVLSFFIPIPKTESRKQQESVLQSAAEGVHWLKANPAIFHLMLFLAGINLVASMYNAAFPAMVLSKASETAMGTVNTVVGITMLAGSILASFLPSPRNRVRAIWYCLMVSMCTENLLLAIGSKTWVWCLGAFLGWITIPLMSTNLEAVYRLNIPMEIQGRVFAARNSFQFFTIPLGYFLGGILVDEVFEPIMAMQAADGLLARLFGTGKGSGAAFLFAALWLTGICVCMIFRVDKHIWSLEEL